MTDRDEPRLGQILAYNAKQMAKAQASEDPDVAAFGRLYARIGEPLNTWLEEERQKKTAPRCVEYAAARMLTMVLAGVIVGVVKEGYLQEHAQQVGAFLAKALPMEVAEQRRARAEQKGESDVH